MKKTLMLLVFGLATFFALNVQAQEETNSPWSTGLDIYSSYIWRGLKFGNGVAFQPSVKYEKGGFTFGGWGSASSSDWEAFEADLFAGYSFGAVSVNLTDYYFGGDWTNFGGMHYLEPAVNVGLEKFSFMGAYMFLPETDDKDFGEEGDVYLEASYTFPNVTLTLGAGDGQYVRHGDFNICNIKLSTSKDVKITDSWTLPVSGSVTLNPSTGGFFVAAGLSF
ncbi:MAG: hypothetical protein ACK5JD_16580 [Mangrovibacterium sp.]